MSLFNPNNSLGLSPAQPSPSGSGGNVRKFEPASAAISGNSRLAKRPLHTLGAAYSIASSIDRRLSRISDLIEARCEPCLERNRTSPRSPVAQRPPGS